MLFRLALLVLLSALSWRIIVGSGGWIASAAASWSRLGIPLRRLPFAIQLWQLVTQFLMVPHRQRQNILLDAVHLNYLLH